MVSSQSDSGSNARVIDIRRDEIEFSVHDSIRSQLRPANGAEKRLPTLLLYDERGLKLFEEITYLDEYYLTNAEIDVLERFGHNIAERIPAGSQLIELGSGYASDQFCEPSRYGNHIFSV